MEAKNSRRGHSPWGPRKAVLQALRGEEGQGSIVKVSHLKGGRLERGGLCPDVVEEDGFEPSKAKPADLQSVPFGHLGTPPYEVAKEKGGAGGRIRTPDLLITNQLLCQLSHIGIHPHSYLF